MKITVTIQTDLTFEANNIEKGIIEKIKKSWINDDEYVYDKMWDMLDEVIKERLKKTYGIDVEILDTSYSN